MIIVVARTVREARRWAQKKELTSARCCNVSLALNELTPRPHRCIAYLMRSCVADADFSQLRAELERCEAIVEFVGTSSASR